MTSPSPDEPAASNGRRRSARVASGGVTKPFRFSNPTGEQSDQEFRPKAKRKAPNESNGVSTLAADSRRSGRLTAKPKVTFDEVADYNATPITKEERAAWKGWVEMESEPAFFNVILRDIGVQGIKVQDLLSLDEEMTAHLPYKPHMLATEISDISRKPIYGLILLFEFYEDDPDSQEADCPKNVWFANQVISNACATIALLNIVMNIPNADIGDVLASLKDFTKDMSPYHRGYTIGNHEHIRNAHNSFVRRSDILNADLGMSNEYDARNKKQSKKSKKTKGKEETAYHFNAFVPVDGHVWKLDGLNSHPTDLGEYTGDWMQRVGPLLQAILAKGEGNIDFTLLSLCRSPLLTIPKEMAVNIKKLEAVEARLNQFEIDWTSFSTPDTDTIRSASETYKVTQNMVDEASIGAELSNKLQDLMFGVEQVMTLHSTLIEAQANLRKKWMDETIAVEDDQRMAERRRHDYTPMINTWLQELAENGILQKLCEAQDGFRS